MNFPGADGALFLARLERRLAAGTDRFCRTTDGMPGEKTGKLQLEVVNQPQCRSILAQGVAPAGEARLVVVQFQASHPGMIVALEDQSFPVSPISPCRLF